VSRELIERWRREVDARLESLLPSGDDWPGRLHLAMRHSVFAGGKRLRPVLALAAAHACAGDLEDVLPAACGLEMIHTYSLIHDDLPALDNDDWRRGVPTCHRAFGEATAILAGDALLTHGLGCLVEFPADPRFDGAKARAAAEVVAAIGTKGMIGGQFEDLESEGKPGTEETLHRIHSHKTGKLIRACLQVGAFFSFASEETRRRLDLYGRKLGLAFQIKDDLLDVESSREALGKAAGKDSARGKLTFPALYGLEKSRLILSETLGEAAGAARSVEGENGPLAYLADFVGSRKN
jgi:geranylgeranyl diphosphate synthase, type II